MKNIYIYIILPLFLCFTVNVMAQNIIKGKVTDRNGKPIPGVKASLVGNSGINVITNIEGYYTLDVSEGQYVDFNYGDKLQKRVKIESETIDVVLSELDNIIEMGLLKKNSLGQTQAVSAIQFETLSRKASTALGNALYGELAGLQMKQNVGWEASAGWSIRGLGSPLFLVDGYARGISWLSMNEIESVNVLKDGAATALYGSRGANGVVMITTKRGVYESFDIDVNYRHGFDIPVNRPEMADAYTYARSVNEALKYDGLTPKYGKTALEAFRNGSNPDIYPNVDWVNEGMRDFGESNQLDIAFRGGGKKLRYFANIEYKNHFGLLNSNYTEFSDRYKSQVRNYALNTRMNIDVDVTSTTVVKVGLFAALKEARSPRAGTGMGNFYSVPSAAFPIHTSHGYWGSDLIRKMNPLAVIADNGYNQVNTRMLEADMRITQDLSMILKGLNAEVSVAYDNSADLQEQGSKSYQYEVNYINDQGEAVSEVYGDNSALTISKSELSGQMVRSAFEAKLGYNQALGLHQVSAAAIYHQDMQEGLGVNNSVYRQSVMGITGYNYANRYFLDIIANYSGNSYMLEGDRFRFYPAVSVAWNLTNEQFMKNVPHIDFMKVRASYGRSGSEAGLAYGLNNHYWGGGSGYVFGDALISSGGLYENKIPIGVLDMEKSDKYNVGIDMRLFKHLNFTLDAYYDERSNILVDNQKITDMIGIALPKQNVGITEYRGLEMSLGWQENRKLFKYYANANISFLDSEIVENGEGYQPFDYLYYRGNKVGQFYGLEAIGFFSDEHEIANSPEQVFSVVSPGDIKYKDQNDDGKIDSYDVVPLGKSTSQPDFFYGINLGFEYKGFGVDMTFQGVSGIQKVLNVDHIHRPLMNNKNISTWYLANKIRWTESTKDIANVPRLSTLSNANNSQNSTQWMEDGSFFKLRNLNIYYTLPEKWTKKMKMDKFQIYVRAENLFSLDHIDYFNCESLTLNYPDIVTVQLGLNLNF